VCRRVAEFRFSMSLNSWLNLTTGCMVCNHVVEFRVLDWCTVWSWIAPFTVGLRRAGARLAQHASVSLNSACRCRRNAASRKTPDTIRVPSCAFAVAFFTVVVVELPRELCDTVRRV
jgi:hypothetical protein